MSLDLGATGRVTLSGRTYEVRVIAETVSRTRFWVVCVDNPARAWKPAEVSVGMQSVFACLRCKRHPESPCIHIEVARRFVAAQTPAVVG